MTQASSTYNRVSFHILALDDPVYTCALHPPTTHSLNKIALSTSFEMALSGSPVSMSKLSPRPLSSTERLLSDCVKLALVSLQESLAG